MSGLRVLGHGVGAPLTLQNSPFWTLTPAYSQHVHVANLRILAPMDKIGNTDGCNIDSCRDVLVENLFINNSDDGVCMKAGLDGFGLNLAIPTEDVLVRNITCADGGRGGFAIGSGAPRDCLLAAQDCLLAPQDCLLAPQDCLLAPQDCLLTLASPSAQRCREGCAT